MIPRLPKLRNAVFILDGDRWQLPRQPRRYRLEPISLPRPIRWEALPSQLLLAALRLTRAAELVGAAVEETLTYYAFPEEHWRRIRTTDVIDKPFRAGFLEFVRDLVSFCGTGDCVAKSKAGGCEPCRAALASLLCCTTDW